MRGDLLERLDELARLRELLAEAAIGTGSSLAIVGPAGIGKTALLRAAIRDAPERGLQVGTATGGELERDHPFGVCRDLLRPLVLAVPPAERGALFADAAAAAAGALRLAAAVPDEDLGAVLHGLYWLIESLAERAPVLLLVDDLHWVDAPSLRLLAYLIRRLEGLPVALLLGSRPPSPGPEGELGAALLADPNLVLLELAPLSPAAVTSLVRDQFGAGAEPDFCTACAEAAGGNPFLTVELLRALRYEGVPATSGSAAAVASVGGARASRTIMRRFRGLSADALAVAHALAVLHGSGNLGLVADVAELSPARTASAVDELGHADLLTAGPEIAFIHPLVANAIYGAIPPGSRAHAHATAARLEYQASHDPDRAAAHLLAAPAVADPWAAEVLLDAGRLALRRGAPQTASRFLGRALTEPPPAEHRHAVLLALGAAERAMGRPDAVGYLTEAIHRAADDAARVEAAIALRDACVSLGRHLDAVAALRDVRARVTDPVLCQRLEASVARTGLTHAGAAALARPEIESINRRVVAGEPLPLDVESVATLVAALTNTGSAADIGARAAAVLDRVRTQPPAALPTWCASASWAIVVAEHPDADRLNGWLAAEARRRGESPLLCIALQNLAWSRFRHGDLVTAAADARTALEVSLLASGSLTLPESVALVMHMHLATGDVESAAATLASHELDGDPDGESWTYAFLLHARAALRLAQDEVGAAVADLRSAGTWCQATHAVSPANLSWRSDLALALHRLGETEEACALASTELALAAGFGAPQALGVAQRTVATITGDLELLELSCLTLEQAGARLELARALVEHGSLVRRNGSRTDARPPLARALDLATRCGAHPLADRARTELRLTGAQIRRTAITGRDALTAAELRTVSLAASGQSNKQIAQTAFVTLKTVESHLAAAYRKLGITGRGQLAAALES